MEKTRLKLASKERVGAEKEALVKKLEESCRQYSTLRAKDNFNDASMDNLEEPSANSSDENVKRDTFDSLRNRWKALVAENAQLEV